MRGHGAESAVGAAARGQERLRQSVPIAHAPSACQQAAAAAAAAAIEQRRATKDQPIEEPNAAEEVPGQPRPPAGHQQATTIQIADTEASAPIQQPDDQARARETRLVRGLVC